MKQISLPFSKFHVRCSYFKTTQPFYCDEKLKQTSSWRPSSNNDSSQSKKTPMHCVRRTCMNMNTWQLIELSCAKCHLFMTM